MSVRMKRGAVVGVIVVGLALSAMQPVSAASGKPGKPSIVSIKSGSAHRSGSSLYVDITVKVKAGSKGGTKLTSTKVSAGTKWCFFLGSSGSCRLTHVKVGTVLKIRAMAKNRYGSGAATSSVKYKAGAKAWKRGPAVVPTPTTTPFVVEHPGGGWTSTQGVARDSHGNFYVAGSNEAPTMPGSVEAIYGQKDGFYAKYSPTGSQLWMHQVGTAGWDYLTAITVGSDGYVYAVGGTNRAFPTKTISGSSDIFIIKIDPTDGSIVWLTEFGSTGDDYPYLSIAQTSTAVYVVGVAHANLPLSLTAHTAGSSEDAFVASFSKADGSEVASALMGVCTANDYMAAVAIDSTGAVIVAGATQCDMVSGTAYTYGQYRGFVAKFSSDLATRTWMVQQVPSDELRLYGVAVDASDNVLFTGSSDAPIGSDAQVGSGDAVIGKLSGVDGTTIWQHNFGTVVYDEGHNVGVSTSGAIYVSGLTDGSITGASSFGQGDGFLVSFDSSGARTGSWAFGTAGNDKALGLDVLSDRLIAIVGETRQGAFPGFTNAAGTDGYFAVNPWLFNPTVE